MFNIFYFAIQGQRWVFVWFFYLSVLSQDFCTTASTINRKYTQLVHAYDRICDALAYYSKQTIDRNSSLQIINP